MAATVSNTTLSAAVARETRTIPLTSVTGLSVGYLLFVCGEAMRVTAVGSASAEVIRGDQGTTALRHASSALVYFGPPDYFSFVVPRGVADSAEEVALPRIVLPGEGPGRVFRILNDSWVECPVNRLANFTAVDPDTGYEYLLVDCQSSFVAGEWACMDGDGLASQLGANSKGRVGIIVDAVAASDTLAWVIRVGALATALFTSGVTTAATLKAGTGCADLNTSAGGNVIYNATCTVAPSTATSPTVGDGIGTALLSNPWVYAGTTDIIP